MPVAAVVIGGILGIALFWIGWYQRKKMQASLAWPQVPGTITGTSIEASESRDSDDGYTTNFTPKVVYRYEVGGRTFAGTRLAWAERSFPSPQRAQVELAMYPVDAPVTVYYNPEKPGDSVLIRKAPGASFILWAGAIILVIVVVAAIKR